MWEQISLCRETLRLYTLPVPLLLIFLTASFPFATKVAVLTLGLQGYVAQSLYKIFQILVPVFWRRKEGLKGMALLWPFAEPIPPLKTWVIATVVALVLSGSAILAIPLLLPIWDIRPETIREGFDARFSVSAGGAVAVVLFLSCANSAIEELHFRAWLDPAISRHLGNYFGILISALAFGCMHGLIFYGTPGIPAAPIFIIIGALTLAGVCWSLLARMRGGIHVAWWSHACTDAVLLLWGLYWLGYL